MVNYHWHQKSRNIFFKSFSPAYLQKFYFAFQAASIMFQLEGKDTRNKKTHFTFDVPDVASYSKRWIQSLAYESNNENRTELLNRNKPKHGLDGLPLGKFCTFFSWKKFIYFLFLIRSPSVDQIRSLDVDCFHM